MLTNFLNSIRAGNEDEGAIGRHSLLLVSLLLLLVLLPVGEVTALATNRFPLLLSIVLLAAIYVNSHQRWMFRVAMVVGLMSLGFSAHAELTGSVTSRMAASTSELMLLGFTTLVMLGSLVRDQAVSLDTIVGGICVYMMIGLLFAIIFMLLTDLGLGAYEYGGRQLIEYSEDRSARATLLLYYSFVTLTTLGYGDVRPVGEIAQMFAVIEAVVGQLYLAIFIARLVGLYLSEARANYGGSRRNLD